MPDSFLIASVMTLSLTYAGMTGLSLAMNRHFGQVWHKRTPPSSIKISLRISGWLLLMLALIPCINYWGTTIGLVIWPGFLSLAAILVALFLAYLPRIGFAIAVILLGATAALAVI